MSDQLSELLQHLIGNSKLQRDRTEEKLIKDIKLTQEDISFISKWIISDIFNAKEINEYLGYLTAFKVIMHHKDLVGIDTVDKLSSLFLILQTYDDFRVRILAGECMGLVCSVKGVEQYNLYMESVKNGILSNMEERQEEPGVKLTAKLSSSKEIFHDTAGWKSLETWMKCFLAIINGIGDKFADVVNEDIIDVTFRAIKHTNRFVRETGFLLITTIVTHKGCSGSDTIFLKTCEEIERGLRDNWSQVRYAASIAARMFLLETKEMVQRHQNEVYSRILGPLCLNRHYLAEGVRIYNQETWRLQFGQSGHLVVAKFMDQVTQFLTEQFSADNHAVREAACGSISEIVSSKIDKSCVEVYFSRMYDALLNGFTDDCWPVRDGACLAIARLCALFPEKCGVENGFNLQDPLFGLFLGNIMDSICSVREGAAKVTSQLLGALPVPVAKPFLEKCEQIIINTLANVEYQKADSKSASTLDKHSNSVYGVVKGNLCTETNGNKSNVEQQQEEEDEMARFSNQQMYSCGSLAPKMNKGKFSRESTGGGCHDGKFQRDAEPWEKADGCVMLASFLCVETEFGRERFPKFLEKSWLATRHKHYTHAPYLLGTVVRTIPRILESLGKAKFKPLLSTYLPLLEEAHSSDIVLTHTSAIDLVDLLARKLGPNILKGRIEMYCSLDFVDVVSALLKC